VGQVGRPKLFKNRKALIEAVDRYFEDVKKDRVPLTITGLARSLGMQSRQTLVNYGHDDKFGDIVCEARMRIEEYAEGRLYDRDGARGAEFNLKCNFGWNDKGNDSGEEDMLKKMDEMIGAIDNAAKRKTD